MDFVKELKKRKQMIAGIIKYYASMGNPISECIVNNAGRIAFLPTQLASASQIDKQFFGIATRLNLIPLWNEYVEDIFFTGNGRKMILLKPFDKYGNKMQLVDHKKCEGKKLSQIVLDSGETLVDFHHHLWDIEFSNSNAIRYDLSTWLNFFGKAEDYYFHSMVLYTFFGVKMWPKNIALYREGEKENLIESVMKPARERVFNEYGFYPLECYFDLMPNIT
jgi:hypothetical protein